jgi:hypothetical protein
MSKKQKQVNQESEPFVVEASVSDAPLAQLIKEDTLVNEEIVTLRDMAQAVQEAAKDMQGKYFALCVFIRERQISPDVLTVELAALGYHRKRISEIKRVSFSTPEIFAEYQNKTIGFKLALERSRAVDGIKEEPEHKTVENRKAFEADLRSVTEKHIPVAGKLPKWSPIQFQAQGCAFTMTFKRVKRD